MTGIWVIIPLKPLTRAKSRLAQALSPEQRQRLAESLFRRVLSIAQGAPQVAGTLVVSRDPKALAIAREFGARTVQESGTPELNPALMRATEIVKRWGGKGVLILPADLPLVTREDLTEMILLGREAHSLVIATDRAHDGTNAMLVRPPGLFPYAYGPGSFARHITLAEEAGAVVHIMESEQMALDIDLPEDLKIYESLIRADGGQTLAWD